MENDLYKFPSAKSFTTWLSLVSKNKESSRKVICSQTTFGINQIAKTFCQVVNSIGCEKSCKLKSWS